MSDRVGLVLGGGGVLGAAWMVGAMKALEQETGLDLREVDQYVGTSAGSILVALLGAGVGVEDLLRNNARHLRDIPPTAVLSALVPEGTGSLDEIGEMIAHAVPRGWAPRPGVTVVALDYETGQRIPFGRDGSPVVDLAQAVMASCAIPGWFHPVTIGEHRYVDGGTWSSTNVDLLVGHDLERVYVLAPTVSFELDSPKQLGTRLERRWRNRVTARCLREVAKLQEEGTEVRVLGPGREDLQAMGANLMDTGRRATVIETSLRTSGAVLRHPEPLPESRHFEEDE